MDNKIDPLHANENKEKKKKEKSWGSNAHIRQNDFKTKAVMRDKEGTRYSTSGHLPEETQTLLQ